MKKTRRRFAHGERYSSSSAAPTYWVLKDGTRYATGYWAEEFANPYEILTDAGHEVVVATPKGVTPTVDMMSLRPAMAGGKMAPSSWRRSSVPPR